MASKTTYELSSELARQYHSITFGDYDSKGNFVGKNTWDDWRLIPASRPVFNPPAPKTHMIDAGGLDGVIDLTQSLVGYTLYSNRTGSFDFYVTNEFDGRTDDKTWAMIYSEVANYLHGKPMRAILDDDTFYYYDGLFAVNSWRSDQDHSKIVIDYNVYPYKMENREAFENWKWDPFNFKTGIIRNYRNIRVDGTAQKPFDFYIYKNDKPVVPEFVVYKDDEDALFTIQWMTSSIVHRVDHSNTINTPYRWPRMVLFPRSYHVIRFIGQGEVSIIYRGGSL